MEETEIAWLAGLLEGEGCFSVQHRPASGRRGQLRVSLRMCDRDVVQHAAALMRSSPVRTYNEANRVTPIFSTRATGSVADAVMRAVRPRMGQRRGAKIDELLALTNLSHHPRQKEAA